MARKRVKVSRGMLFTWFMLAGLIFLFAPENWTSRFQFAFARIFRLPLSVGRSISLSAHPPEPLTDVVGRKQYDELQNHLANVTELLYQERREVERLSGLRYRLGLEGANLVPADIITALTDKLHSKLIINRGERDGLKKDQFVLGCNSIIGRISDVSSTEACVRLVTDPASKIEVKIAELNSGELTYVAKGLLCGSGTNKVKIPLLSIDHKVKVGDIVYACKKPGFLGAAMIVGKVTQCKNDDKEPLLWDITVEPACDLQMLKSVDVIIMNRKN